ncbi:MAG: cytochrome c1 [Gammaproteobacteria bacterium]|nr:cytochrome c1 [Gammaproteobacteria bacterium]
MMFKHLHLQLGSRFLAVLVACLGIAGTAAAAGGGALHDRADVDVSNVASLQRGARNFVNFCLGCHSAQYVRYNRLAQDLQITEQQLIENLMFAAEKPQETMTIAMRGDDAVRWFGTSAPDLSLIARNRGADYLYNFLRAFYVDPSRPTGVNNLMLANAAMPHVLWELQGVNEAVFEDETDAEGVSHKVFREFRQVTPGRLSAEEYEQFVGDLVNFLVYIGEPMQLERQRLGIWVLAFLLVFGILSYLLKQEIWKDVK